MQESKSPPIKRQRRRFNKKRSSTATSSHPTSEHSRPDLLQLMHEYDSQALSCMRDIARAVQARSAEVGGKSQATLYLTGGAVRDALKTLTPNNFDCVIIGLTPQQVLDTVQALELKSERTRARDFHERLVLKKNGSRDIRIDLPRIRGAKKEDDFENGRAEVSLKGYLKSLDFTINALALDPLTGQLFDFYRGLPHLNNKIIDIVEPSYIQPRFKSSYALMYRAARLSANLNLTPSQRLIKSFSTLTKRGSQKHVKREYIKSDLTEMLIEGIYPEQGFLLLHNLNLLEYHLEILKTLSTERKHYLLSHALFSICQQQERIITKNLGKQDHMASLLAAFLKPFVEELHNPATTTDWLTTVIDGLCFDRELVPLIRARL